MSIRDVVMRTIAVSAAGLPVLMSGCAFTSGEVEGTRLSDNLVVYAPFDNDRDSGPSYLVDSQYHHAGDEGHILDLRPISQPAGVASVDSSNPPQAQTLLPPQPLR